MSEPSLVYERFERELASADIESSGAEVHGIICGLLCAGQSDAYAVLLRELLPDSPGDDLLARECTNSLRKLFDETEAAIDGPGLGFSPFMPEEEKSLKVRARAVSEWCQGFLYGIGIAGVDPEGQLSEETREALNDLIEITRMDVDALEESDEDEDVLVEVGEFLWVAAMLVHEEIVHGPK
ncbi:UPF0149 family protein [Solemya velesiana gill symbiont]|uniref:YecA family protein n=1 Tax=Solemya velesiana gill symbiont TaxID=1918948 RepID=A0A1T2KUK0_9GAMM|nr:UPF0149 family protein [Solemya velesiana gill symbiont]OOZ36525.1 hypothetical protein BOW51_06845 [Solemya velesiana gill symbiont]